MPRLRIKPNALGAAAFTFTIALCARPAAAQYLYQNDFEDQSLIRPDGTFAISSASSQYTFPAARQKDFTILPSTGTGWRTAGDGRNFYLGISDTANPYSDRLSSGISGFTGNTTVSLDLTGLTPGNNYFISFDLFMGKTVDGNFNQAQFGPDRFQVLVNQASSTKYIDTTFNNYDANDTGPGNGANIRNAGQSYSDTDLTGYNASNPSLSTTHAPFTGADVSHQDPSREAFNNYSIYYFGQGFVGEQNRPANTAPRIFFKATSDTAQIQWISNFQLRSASGGNGERDEFWALDNVQVTDLPEPGTFGMMALGLIPLGFGLYQRMRKK